MGGDLGENLPLRPLETRCLSFRGPGFQGGLGRGVTCGQTLEKRPVDRRIPGGYQWFAPVEGALDRARALGWEETWVKTYPCVLWRLDVCPFEGWGSRDGWGGVSPVARPPKRAEKGGAQFVPPQKGLFWPTFSSPARVHAGLLFRVHTCGPRTWWTYLMCVLNPGGSYKAIGRL